jgi:hypothetical protein
MFARGLTFLDEVLQSGSNNAWQFSLFSEAYRVCYYAVHTVGLGIQQLTGFTFSSSMDTFDGTVNQEIIAAVNL